MKPIHCTYLFFTLFLFSKESPAQKAPLDFNLVTGTNEISIGKIMGITQDKLGYTWFCDATNSCLIRYDGYRMKTYRNDPMDSNSIAASNFECFAADSSGNIWLQTNEGVDKLNPLTGIATHYRFNKNSNCKGGFSASILVDHSNSIWLGTSEGLYNLDQKTGSFTCYSYHADDPTSISCNTVRALYEDHEGTLWVGTGLPFDTSREGGLNKFNRSTGKFTRYMHNAGNPHSLSNDKIKAMFEDSRGVFWVGTQGDGLHIMDRKTGTFERLTYDPAHPEKLSRPPVKKENDFDHITFITEDIAGKIWIGTYSEGLVRYDPVTKQIDHFRADKTSLHGFTDSTSWCAFTSRDGTVWIATERNNLFRVDPLQASFSTTSLNDMVWAFAEDPPGTLWTGFTGNGMAKIDLQKKDGTNISRYIIDPSRGEGIEVNSICPLGQGMFMLATFKGIYFFNSVTGIFTKAPYNENGTGNPVTGISIINDKHGKFYIAGIGFYILDSLSGNLSEYRVHADRSDGSSISADTLITSYRDKAGNIWLGTLNGGLNLFDPNTNSFRYYLQGLSVFTIYEDTKGILWVGSDHGLYNRNKDSVNFSPFSNKGAPLQTARITGLIEDNDGNIWGSSSSLGLFRINTSKQEVCIYGRKFATAAFPGVKNEAWKTADGKLFVGNTNGYYSFFPRQVINYTPPVILLTGLKLNGKSVTEAKSNLFNGTIEEATEIRLHHNQNIFSIDFAAIHFADPENNILQYMLEGYETEWRNVEQLKTAYYFNVSPGHFTFRVKAWSSYGLWSEKAVTITILPPWWQTWWAYTLYVLLLAGLIWTFIKWRTRILKKEKIMLEEKVAKRTRELKEEKELVESTLSELKSTQAQLIQSEKMASLGELTAGIAHEIQNPLNFVNNFSEVSTELIDEMNMEIDKGNTEEVKSIAGDLKQNLEKINHHGKRADAIVKGMLQHSQTSTGKKEPTDINKLADEYLRLAYHGFKAKEKSFNATLKTNFDETIGNINIIPQDIGRVILNLINNAFYAVAEKKNQQPDGYEPMVEVSTKKMNDIIEIKVRDNGNGVPQKVLDKIFQPFFTTKPTGQGTGLGLSLSYDIIKTYGGQLKVETNEGESACFLIILPLKEHI